MKKYLIILVLLFFISPAFGEMWTKNDTYRELTWATLFLIDYGQTLNIAKNPDKYEEKNQILGRHPSQSSVHKYMLSVAILHPIISYYLLPEYRKYWQYITIGIEADAVTNNFSIGIGINF